MRRWKIVLAGIAVALIALPYFFYVPDRSVDELIHWQNAQSRFVTVDGVDVHYRREGNPQGPTLLLIHGTSSSLHTWDGWVARMRDELDIVRLDIPGFGLTGPRADNDYSLPAYVAFIDAFADTLGLDTFALAGNSLGGNIAWQYAASHDARLTHLILIDATGFAVADRTPSLVFRLARLPLISNSMQYVAPRSMYEKSLKEVYADDTKISPALVDRFYELSLREGNRRAFVQRARQWAPNPVDRLRLVQTPTLVQWGEQDLWVPPEHGPLFQEAIAHATLITYPDVGHTPMEEAAEKTAQDALAFINRTTLPTAQRSMQPSH